MDVGSLSEGVGGAGGSVDICVSYSRVPVVSEIAVKDEDVVRIFGEDAAEGVVVDIGVTQ